MHGTRQALLLALVLTACGEDAAPALPPRPAPAPVARPVESAPAPDPEPDPEPLSPATGYVSAFHHPESLLRPLDGFPLPAGTLLREQGRDLAEYEVEASLRTVEEFYLERGFRITRPGKLPGIIVTRTDTGTRLQVQPGRHRAMLLRFFR